MWQSSLRLRSAGLSILLLLLWEAVASQGTKRLIDRSLQVASGGQYSIQVEVEALLAFKNSLQDPYNVLMDWKGADPCAFHGVLCEEVGKIPGYTGASSALPRWRKVVTGLDLNGFGLIGQVSPRITALKFLGFIHISHNKLAGRLPDLSPLRFLNELDISCNRLSGPFPPWILSLKYLKYLDIRFNAFTGILPSQVFELDLDVLAVNNNQFTSNQNMWQTLPRTNASLLVLASNPLGGSLPDLTPLSNTLLEFAASNVKLSGRIPATLGKLKEVRVLDVSRNQIKGALPPLDVGLQNLVSFNLASNLLSQDIQGIRNFLTLPKLQSLRIDSNYFRGVAGPIAGTSQKLSATQNCISGFQNQRDTSSCTNFAKSGL